MFVIRRDTLDTDLTFRFSTYEGIKIVPVFVAGFGWTGRNLDKAKNEIKESTMLEF